MYANLYVKEYFVVLICSVSCFNFAKSDANTILDAAILDFQILVYRSNMLQNYQNMLILEVM